MGQDYSDQQTSQEFVTANIALCNAVPLAREKANRVLEGLQVEPAPNQHSPWQAPGSRWWKGHISEHFSC